MWGARMSHSRIVRLRGDGLALVWPEDIEPLIAQSARLRGRSPRRVPGDHPDVVANPERFRPLREWEAQLDEAQDDAAQGFGNAQGWRLGRCGSPRLLLSPRDRRRMPRRLPAWSLRDDCYEHPDFFYVGRRLAAVVVHLYPMIALDGLPNAVVVDQLPSSWYYPDLTTAYVLRSANIATPTYQFHPQTGRTINALT